MYYLLSSNRRRQRIVDSSRQPLSINVSSAPLDTASSYHGGGAGHSSEPPRPSDDNSSSGYHSTLSSSHPLTAAAGISSGSRTSCAFTVNSGSWRTATLYNRDNNTTNTNTPHSTSSYSRSSSLLSSSYLSPNSALAASSYLGTRDSAPSISTSQRLLVQQHQQQHSLGSSRSSLLAERHHQQHTSRTTYPGARSDLRGYSTYQPLRSDIGQGSQASGSVGRVSVYGSSVGSTSNLSHLFEYSRPINAAEVRRRLEFEREMRRRPLTKY